MEFKLVAAKLRRVSKEVLSARAIVVLNAIKDKRQEEGEPVPLAAVHFALREGKTLRRKSARAK